MSDPPGRPCAKRDDYGYRWGCEAEMIVTAVSRLLQVLEGVILPVRPH